MNGGAGSTDYVSGNTLKTIEGDGCDNTQYSSADVFFVQRGNCTFAEKALLAKKNGGILVIVGNNVPSLYSNTTTGIVKDACELDCEESSSDVQSQCEAGCASNICIQAENPSNRQIQFCCIKDQVTDFHVNETIDIPVVFVSVRTSSEMQEFVRASSVSSVRIVERPLEFSASVVVILFIGVLAVALSSLRGSWKERKKMFQKKVKNRRSSSQTETKSSSDDDDIPTTVLTYTHVAQYLCLASFFLLFMFMLIKLGADFVVMFIIIIFCLASFSAVSFVLFEPVLKRIVSLKFYDTQVTSCVLPLIQERVTLSRGEVLTSLLSLGVVITWFLNRHTMWYLQNVLGICVCCTFTVLVQLPNLSIATSLLVVFLFYDIFMVFLSPFIFHSSVMLDVATAGGSDSQSTVQGSNVCHKSYGENMPMLFLVPRDDWRGGYTMLGLGDVIFPALLTTLMLRVDYMITRGCCQMTSQEKVSIFRKIGYFPILLLGYCIGLIFAFLANTYEFTINGVKGQPALLYLVPCTLGPAVFLAWYRGELKLLWRLRGSDVKKTSEEDCSDEDTDGGKVNDDDNDDVTSGLLL